MSQDMSEQPNDSTRSLPTLVDLPEAPPKRLPEQTCVSASHTILFEAGGHRCSVCDELLVPEDDDADDDGEIGGRGRGLLVWARGDERRYEEPELCPSCASAIGVTAL